MASRTATGVQTLSAQQATGFDIQIRRFQESFKHLLTQILALYRQYMPPGKTTRIRGVLGEPDTTISRDDLMKLMDLRFTGNSLSTDREVERNTYSFLAQGVMGPQALGFLLQLGVTDPLGIAQWYRELFQRFDVSSVDRIIKTPPQPALRTPEQILGRVLAGEDVVVMPGENHQAVVDGLSRYMQSPDQLGSPPETLLVIEKQLRERQQQAMQEMAMQMMAQMQAQQQAAMMGPQGMQGAPQPPPGIGGAPTQLPQPPQPAGLPF